jgi:hypothetical protein
LSQDGSSDRNGSISIVAARTSMLLSVRVLANDVVHRDRLEDGGENEAANLITLYRDEIAAAKDPDAKRAELVREYVERFANPYVAASRGYIDDIIEPHETRPRLIAALRSLAGKCDTNPRKKHGNIPL